MQISFGNWSMSTRPRRDPAEEAERLRDIVNKARDDGGSRIQYAAWLHTSGDAAGAEAEYREAIRLLDLEPESESQLMAVACHQLGRLLTEQNCAADAVPYLRRALTFYEVYLPDRWPLNLQTRKVREELRRAVGIPSN